MIYNSTRTVRILFLFFFFILFKENNSLAVCAYHGHVHISEM